MATSSTISNDDDPLTFMLRPPHDETLIDRDRRIRKETEAKMISDAIDEQIELDREKRMRRKPTEIRLLLLGQSSSGKSTLQKQFQLLYAPYVLDAARLSWIPVVYIHLVRSVRVILEALEFEDNHNKSDPILPPPTSPIGVNLTNSSKGKEKARDDTPPASPSTSTPDSTPWTQQFATLRLRLLPLLSTEDALARQIGAGVQFAPGKEEVFVRNGWAGVRSKRNKNPTNNSEHPTRGDTKAPSAPATPTSTTTSEYQHQEDERDEITKQVATLLCASKDDVKVLWEHSALKSVITERRLKFEESSQFFVDNLDRIAQLDYLPSDNDILRARVRTIGVFEYTFQVPTDGKQKVFNWKLYDVEGVRGQRRTWIPYFEDATAIIILAPISAFNQYLEEDHKTNRVADSLQLFTDICSNRVLQNAHLILCLNKTDVLKEKLAAGVEVRKYITSYGDRPNEYSAVSSYFATQFKHVHKKNSINPSRELYTHLTSVIDIQMTRNIIFNVRDGMLRFHLNQSSII